MELKVNGSAANVMIKHHTVTFKNLVHNKMEIKSKSAPLHHIPHNKQVTAKILNMNETIVLTGYLMRAIRIFGKFLNINTNSLRTLIIWHNNI